MTSSIRWRHRGSNGDFRSRGCSVCLSIDSTKVDGRRPGENSHVFSIEPTEIANARVAYSVTFYMTKASGELISLTLYDLYGLPFATLKTSNDSKGRGNTLLTLYQSAENGFLTYFNVFVTFFLIFSPFTAVFFTIALLRYQISICSSKWRRRRANLPF